MYKFKYGRVVYLLLIYLCVFIGENDSASSNVTTSTSTEKSNQATSPPPPSFNIFNIFNFRPQISVSKFPPIIEIIAQRIQSQFSNYIHEDLSRPPTWDQATYKPIAPIEASSTISSQINDHVDFNDDNNNNNQQVASTQSSTVFKIPTVAPPKLIFVDTYELVHSANFNSTIEVEYELRRLTNRSNVQNDVINILRSNALRMNETHIFEIDKNKNKGGNDNDNNIPYFTEISTMFLENETNKKDIVAYLLRQEISAEDYDKQDDYKNNIDDDQCRRCLIALTQIGQHVYINTIHIKRKTTKSGNGGDGDHGHHDGLIKE